MNIPGNVQKIIEILHNNSHDAYIVGGCVRDTLLGRIPGDWDITTSAHPEEIKQLFRRTIDTGIEHGTVTVRMHGESYEVTTYRVDGEYSDHRRPDSVVFTDNLVEDLKRRDFTINAMAYNDVRGLVDEFDGKQDLENGIIRCVGNPDERFEEDALRMLRAIRFSAQLGFSIEENTLDAIKKHAPELVNVSAERILVELNKTLASQHPENMQLLWDLGLTDYISASFKEIRDAGGIVPGTPGSWAALMRDLTGVQAKTILKELKSDNDTIRNTVALVEEYKLPFPEDEIAIRHTLNHIGPELFEHLMDLFDSAPERADAGRAAMAREQKKKILARNDAYTIGMLAVTGNDVRPYARTGPDIGRILNELLEKVMQRPELNEKEILLGMLNN